VVAAAVITAALVENFYPMKILIAHNDYGRYSGEEAVVDRMEKMLTGAGHSVRMFRPSTANYQSGLDNKLRVFLSGIYSFEGVQGMKKLLRAERPDIINIHNLYPFISPAALFACRAAGVPVVMTVHNYRLICPTGLFLRDGRPCEYCLDRGHEWGCVKFNCGKDVFKSVGYALRGTVARKIGAFAKNVDVFVCLTEFQRRKLIEAGFAAEKVRVIPNSMPTAIVSTASVAGTFVGYVGRLSDEKGWDLLVEVARRNPGIRFEVAGEGVSGSAPDNIRFRGFLDGAELAAFYREARFVVIPSRCYEGLPVVALEAMAAGKAVVAPDHGGFTELIGRGSEAVGCLFVPGEVLDMETAICALWTDGDRAQAMGLRAMERVTAGYSVERVSRQWEELFAEITTV